MEIDKQHIKRIKSLYAQMRTKEDLLQLLNEVKPKVFGEKAIPFAIKHLNYHADPKLNPNRYTKFVIKKKSGGSRVIHAPNSGLKAILKCLNHVFEIVYRPHEAAYGFIRNRSIVDNARIHTESFYVYNLDLKNFFPSVDQARVWGRLRVPPFNLNEKYQRLQLANIMAALVCHEMEVERIGSGGEPVLCVKSVLPQGAPTSPMITNMICEKLDRQLTELAKHYGLKYTRYADDITFSSLHNVYQDGSEFVTKLHKIIEGQNFVINGKKTRLQRSSFRQEVTGIIVNEVPNVSKRYVKDLRAWIYKWEQYGYERTSAMFIPSYKADKGHVRKGTPEMRNVLEGKLEYLKMVKGEQSPTYLSLRRRMDKLQLKSSNEALATLVIPKQPKETKVRKFIDPSALSKFLLDFNQDPLLKYTCHSIDDEGVINDVIQHCGLNSYSFVDHQALVANRCKELLKRSFVNANIKNLILVYLTGANYKGINVTWSSDEITANWKSPELIAWARSNPGIVPHPGINLARRYRNKGYKLTTPFKSKLTGKSVKYFVDLVIHFKNMFHIRGDNSLQNLIEFNNNSHNWNDKLVCHFDESNFHPHLELFTDVDKLMQGYTSIVRMILDVVYRFKQPKPQLNIGFKVEGDSVYIRIHHLNSQYRKTIDNVLARTGEWESAFTNNLINGLCEFYIRADFGNGNYALINFWNGKSKTAEQVQPIQGVEYILKFNK